MEEHKLQHGCALWGPDMEAGNMFLINSLTGEVAVAPDGTERLRHDSEGTVLLAATGTTAAKD
eukprot:10906101-Prorocentrum_lima.AAC.1